MTTSVTSLNKAKRMIRHIMDHPEDDGAIERLLSMDEAVLREARVPPAVYIWAGRSEEAREMVRWRMARQDGEGGGIDD